MGTFRAQIRIRTNADSVVSPDFPPKDGPLADFGPRSRMRNAEKPFLRHAQILPDVDVEDPQKPASVNSRPNSAYCPLQTKCPDAAHRIHKISPAPCGDCDGVLPRTF
jgi:hypothetical protein